MHRWYLLMLALFLYLASCQTSSPPRSEPRAGIYYWKTTLHFTDADQELAANLGIKDFYLRYLDIDWSPTLQQAVPVGELSAGNYYDSYESNRLENFRIVPTIFITNLVFTKEIDTRQLAQQVAAAVNTLSDQMRWSIGASYDDDDYLEMGFDKAYEVMDSLQTYTVAQINEVQIDCDWTAGTREKYFQFLHELRTSLPQGYRLSCTIRLHQFRDRAQAGIPPVDEGTLMCYNMAPPQEWSTEDAIFDLSLLKGYLQGDAYPLPLRGALPVFSWGSAFQQNRFRGIIADLREDDLPRSLFTTVGDHRYRLERDTVMGDIYLRAGDEIRIDAAEQKDLAAAVDLLHDRADISQLIFFDWQPAPIRAQQIGSLISTFYEK